MGYNRAHTDEFGGTLIGGVAMHIAVRRLLIPDQSHQTRLYDHRLGSRTCAVDPSIASICLCDEVVAGSTTNGNMIRNCYWRNREKKREGSKFVAPGFGYSQLFDLLF